MAFQKFDIVIYYLFLVIFNCYQKKDGKITSDELREVLGGGDLMPLSIFENIIQQADIDGDGKVNKLLIFFLIILAGL